MLNVGIIGIGNTGNQIASLGNQLYGFPVIAINSSEKDLETVPDAIPKKKIQDKEGMSKGAGKDRKLAKSYLKDSIINLLKDPDVEELCKDIDICFIISSTGGGTGSGTALLLSSIMSKQYQNKLIVSVGVLPSNGEALSSHVNTLEYLNELYSVMDKPVYMLYDNDKVQGIPSYQVLEKVNREVIEDINVIRCFYNYTTKFDSIDDRDMMRLISFPGRLVVSRLTGIKEKDCENTTIEEMLLDTYRKNCHVETQRDKKVMASGIISNLSQTLTEEFDNNIPKVRDFTGDPIHAFNHIYVNEDRKQDNNVFLIVSGLSKANDKINKINDRVEEIIERQKVMEDDDAIDNDVLGQLSAKTADNTEKSNEENIDLTSIFSDFGI